MKSVIALLSLAAVASAHFTLDYPLTRGFDEDLEPNFCGGFNSTLLPRQLFPLSGGPVVIDSSHPTADVAITISFDEAPTSFADFNTTSSGAAIPILKGFGSITVDGIWCFNVDVAALGVAGVADGTNATLQVTFNGGDGALYQCSDITLSSSFTASDVICQNGTATAATSTVVLVGSATTTASGTAATTTASTGAAGREAVVGGLLGLVGLAGMVL